MHISFALITNPKLIDMHWPYWLCFIHSYIGMFVSLRRTRQKVTATTSSDTSFAMRFFLIVITDALCWTPIITFKLIALANVKIPGGYKLVIYMWCLTHKHWHMFIQTMETKGFFQFVSIINVLVGSFCFIWISMLRVYDHYKYLTFSLWRLTLHVRIWRL